MSPDSGVTNRQDTIQIKLPEPVLSGKISLEESLFKRRSIREFSPEPIMLDQISQLLWAAQGITENRFGLRTAPSAGALYPLKLYMAVTRVNGIRPGIYKYIPGEHILIQTETGSVEQKLSRAALEQEWIRDAAAIIVITAVYERTTQKYGKRGIRYVHMEVGHAAQNISLQAQLLNMGSVIVGAFYDDEVKKVMKLTMDEQPLCIIPVGIKLSLN